jgi:16S rRNA (cytosine967-C5)-methyltransferase
MALCLENKLPSRSRPRNGRYRAGERKRDAPHVVPSEANKAANGRALSASVAPPVRAGLLAHGCAALAQVLTFAGPADATLRRFFLAHRALGRHDRGFIAESVFAVLRRLSYFAAVAGTHNVRGMFIAAAGTLDERERRSLEFAISAEESRWLNQLPEPAMTLAMRAELPEWMVTRLQVVATPRQILRLGTSMQAPAPLDLRVNTLLTTREGAIDGLRASGYTLDATPYSPFGLRVQGKPAIERHPLFLGGRVEVQDEGSQLLGLLLGPRRREMVADFCAGAGGKTLLLGQLMRSQGRLYAFDVAPERLRKLRERAARAGLSNIHPEVIASENDPRLARLKRRFDRVLVDAPCTGTGTLRRNPDLKWRQNEAALASLSARQSAILSAAARLVKPGGRLVYATCSVLPEENDAVVDAFLTRHPEFAEEDCQALLDAQGVQIDCGKRLRLSTHRHGTDGFFAASFTYPTSADPKDPLAAMQLKGATDLS